VRNPDPEIADRRRSEAEPGWRGYSSFYPAPTRPGFTYDKSVIQPPNATLSSEASSEGSPGPVVLRGADVIDGTGAPRRRSDVAVAGGRIVGVGENFSSDFPEIDLSGLVLSPGFIDPHTHYDAQIFWDPDLTPSNWHGVTTTVMGNCGFTLAPTRPAHRDTILRTLENVEGMSLAALEAGVAWSFESFPDYLRAVDLVPKRMNVACMIGHTALRWFVLGDDAPDRRATDEEVSRMCDLVAEAMRCGAIGFSTSLHSHVGAFGKPVPSRAASFDELLLIAGTLRSVGAGTIEAATGGWFGVDEAIRMAQAAGRPLTWSGNVLVPSPGQGGAAAATAAVDACRSAKASVFPQFPCRPIVNQVTLQDPFPLHMASEGFSEVLRTAPEKRLAVYQDEKWRSRTKDTLTPGSMQLLADATVQETDVHRAIRNGPTLGELAAQQDCTPFDLLIDLAIADRLATRFKVAVANTDETVIAQLLRDRQCVVGLGDAGAHVSQLCDANYATYLLAYWVRERDVLPLEFGVWRLSGQPAALYGIQDRGRIAEGTWADLIAFDPAQIGPGDIERVWDFPGRTDRLIARGTGIEAVWVNGSLVCSGGQDVPGVAPGTLLRGRVAL
jgi:N-acyl-D-amino-acid deacylase